LLNKLASINNRSFIFCDSNINLLKITNKVAARDYLDTVHNNGFLQLISKATRISGNSYSLIDHIFCNHFNHLYKTGTFLADISDHLLNFVSLNPLTTKTKHNPPNKHTRIFSLDKMTGFRDVLQQQNWFNVTSVQEVDASFDAFWDIFKPIYETYFPLKILKLNKNRHSINDFMTPGLLISRGRKIELHRLALIDPTNFSDKFKLYRNIFNATLRASKKLTYDMKFSQFAKNPKKTWELLNELTSKNKSKSNSNIPFIISNGNKIDSPQEIATEFNSFFVNAGQSIVNSVPATDTSPESFLPNPDTETPEFDLGNISPTHILDIIKSFQNKSSLDIDGISLKLLKFICPTICTPLAHIFNLSFVSGIFPTKLKLNRTVPISKVVILIPVIIIDLFHLFRPSRKSLKKW
jgi:hypothetical protein